MPKKKKTKTKAKKPTIQTFEAPKETSSIKMIYMQGTIEDFVNIVSKL